MPRVALVGAGRWGSNLLRVLSDLSCLEVVCDADAIRREAVSRDTGLPTTASLSDVVDDPTIDAVVVATPPRSHCDIALRALGAAKHVLVEKPMAMSVHEGLRMRDAARAAGRVLMTDHVLEFHPAVVRLRQLLAGGDLGRVRYVYSHRLNLGQVRTDESSLWSFAPHDIGLVLAIAGEPTTVACRGGAYLTSGVADVTMTSLGFADGVEGHVFVSWLHPFKEHRFVVVGEEQMAVFDDTAPWPEKLTLYRHRVEWVDGRLPVAHKAEGISVPVEESEPLREACSHFLKCVQGEAEARTGPEYGLAVLGVLESAERSLRAGGQPVWPGLGHAFVHPTATVDHGATIGEGTRVWHHAHVMTEAVVGRDCVLGQNVFVGRGVRIGDGVKVQNNVSVFEGVELEDGVFCGPSAVFTNVLTPRAEIERKSDFRPTVVRRGATIGANATIVCGHEVGPYAMVAAGAVVTSDVRAHRLVMGVPARPTGWVCVCGHVLDATTAEPACSSCGRHFRLDGDELVALGPDPA